MALWLRVAVFNQLALTSGVVGLKPGHCNMENSVTASPDKADMT